MSRRRRRRRRPCDVAGVVRGPDGTTEFRRRTSGPTSSSTATSCRGCSTQACVVACPANLFVPTTDGGILFNYEQCFECGTCYLVCNSEGAITWTYPEGGHGVVFRPVVIGVCWKWIAVRRKWTSAGAGVSDRRPGRPGVGAAAAGRAATRRHRRDRSVGPAAEAGAARGARGRRRRGPCASTRRRGLASADRRTPRWRRRVGGADWSCAATSRPTGARGRAGVPRRRAGRRPGARAGRRAGRRDGTLRVAPPPRRRPARGARCRRPAPCCRSRVRRPRCGGRRSRPSWPPARATIEVRTAPPAHPEPTGEPRPYRPRPRPVAAPSGDAGDRIRWLTGVSGETRGRVERGGGARPAGGGGLHRRAPAGLGLPGGTAVTRRLERPRLARHRGHAGR